MSEILLQYDYIPILMSEIFPSNLEMYIFENGWSICIASVRLKIYASYLLQIEKPRELPVRVTGVIRGSEKPSIFVPTYEPSGGQ